MFINDFFKKTITQNTIETKSANFDMSGIQLVTGNSLDINALTPKELMAYNVHWVYTCNTKNAGTCSTIPLKLFYESKGKKTVQGSIPVKGKTDIVEIQEHPFIDLLKNVNPYMNWTDLVSLVFGYLGLIGNAYVRIEKDKNGTPIALYPLMSEYVTLSMDNKNGEVLAYKYFDKQVYKPEDIIKFSNLQPGSLVNGRGDLEACIKAVQRYCYYDQAESYLNKNNMRPDFIASYKTSLSEKEQNDLEKVWYKKFSKKGLGKPLITSEMDVKTLGLAPKEMAYKDGRTSCIQEILATFGCPEALIFSNLSNYASSYTAMTMYYKYTIFPKMQRFVEKLNEQLLPLYDDNLYVDFDKTIEVNPVEQSAMLSTYVENGIMSKNEAREVLGLEAIEEEPKTAVESIEIEEEVDEAGN